MTPSAGRDTPRAGNAAPPRWALTLAVWVLAYPALTLLTVLVSPFSGDWPLPLRTLVISAVFVPLMVNLIVPTAARLVRRIANASRRTAVSERSQLS